MHHGGIDNTGTIGLESIPPSVKQPILTNMGSMRQSTWTGPIQARRRFGVSGVGNVRFGDMVRVGVRLGRRELVKYLLCLLG